MTGKKKFQKNFGIKKTESTKIIVVKRFQPKNICCPKYFGPKIFWVQTMEKETLGPVKKNLGSKKFWVKRYWVQKIQVKIKSNGRNKMLVQTNAW